MLRTSSGIDGTDSDETGSDMPSENPGQEPPPDGGIRIEIFFNGDETLRVGRMRRAEADCKFSTFVHDLTMQAVADWEAEQAAKPPAVTAAD